MSMLEMQFHVSGGIIPSAPTLQFPYVWKNTVTMFAT